MKTKFEVFKEAVVSCLKDASINVTEIRCLCDVGEEIEKIKRMQFLNCFGEGFLEFATDIDLERIVFEIHYEYDPFDDVSQLFIGLDWDLPLNLIEVGFPGIAKTLTETSRIGYPKYILRRAIELNRPGIVTNYLDALEESERVKVLDRYLDATITSDNEMTMTMTLMRYKHERGMMTDTGIGRL